MTKAKLKVTDRAVSDLGTVIHSTVELLDADGTMVEYGIKEFNLLLEDSKRISLPYLVHYRNSAN